MEKRGRPPAEDPRSAFAGVKLTPEEKQKLEKEAQALGLTLSSYLRQKALKGKRHAH